MSTYRRVVGPPGCGKTQFLRNQVEKWVDSDGIPPDRIVLCSFTRTAASVLRGRVAVPQHNATTLHSLAYRAIGHEPIAEVGELAKEWNSQNIPQSWKLGADRLDLEEGVQDEADRGSMLAQYSLMRSSMGTHPQYGVLLETTKHFAKRWEDFKGQTGSIDFTDMIDLAMLQTTHCPGDPECFVVDEAQDLNPMQWTLAHQWGAAARNYLVAGDPAQVLYGWIGARPDELLIELEPAQHRLLSQSYRLPQRIQAEAERWLSQHSGAMMAGRSYRPHEAEGIVTARDYTSRDPDGLLEDIEQRHGTVMVLATCSYLLEPTLSMLRSEGVPFHNPHRRTNGRWNPLQPEREGRTTTQQRVRVFLELEWTGPRATTWLDLLPAEWFASTKKGTLEWLAAQGQIADAVVLNHLKEQARGHVAARDVRWLADVALKQYKNALSLCAAIVRRQGVRGLSEEPKVIIGTIHSVKGGEADTVVLYPDLPKAAIGAASESVEGRDAVVRQWYVGMTRARHELITAAAVRERDSIYGL